MARIVYFGSALACEAAGNPPPEMPSHADRNTPSKPTSNPNDIPPRTRLLISPSPVAAPFALCRAYVPNRTAARALALAASSSRFFGVAVVSSDRKRRPEIFAISSTAPSNAASFACDGLLKPVIFRTNCSDAARTSSGVTGGSKLNSVLIFLHTEGSQYQFKNSRSISTLLLTSRYYIASTRRFVTPSQPTSSFRTARKPRTQIADATSRANRAPPYSCCKPPACHRHSAPKYTSPPAFPPRNCP